MRYARGSVAITSEGDIPLLRQLRNSRFVSHHQLFELLLFENGSSCRSTFNWRIQRLLKTGHMERLPVFCSQGSPLYRITPTGLLELESRGEFCIALHSRSRNMPHVTQVFHALELNSIRLALARNALLVEWRSEIEIASVNMVSSMYQKDYDAIVKVWVQSALREFAVEYERSLKSANQYLNIRAALQAERQVPCVVYLTASADLMAALLCQLTPVSTRVGFATARAFIQQLMATRVATDAEQNTVSLEEFLRYAHPLYASTHE